MLKNYFFKKKALYIEEKLSKRTAEWAAVVYSFIESTRYRVLLHFLMKHRLISEFPIDVNRLVLGVVYIPSETLRNTRNGIYTTPNIKGLMQQIKIYLVI
jgi:hypothetical protein